MKIDLEHLHFWMQAIRQSPDPMRTMDAFWQGQLKSKEWLINNLVRHVDQPVSIDIHGGWVGVLASLMFQSQLGPMIKHIRSIDIDSSCESIAKLMNRKEEIEGRFNAVTADMCGCLTEADVVINTSCEHITQKQYIAWIDQVPRASLLILQSNNYNIPEHVRTADSLEAFKDQCKIKVVWAEELELPLYKRFMLIGYKI